jgi:hypothetical protein
MFSFSSVLPWMRKYPVDGPKMKLADLPAEKIAPVPLHAAHPLPESLTQ